MNAAFLAGHACSLDEATEAAVDLLAKARLALVWGLVESTVEAQREAARIASLLGSVLDSAASEGHAPVREAFERNGLVTASLGELRRQADLVVFWGCDPDRLHPGFVERYAAPRASRTRLAIDIGDARGPAGIEERLALPAEREVEALLVLRAFVRGRRIEPDVAAPLGLPLETLRGLAGRLTGCAYGAILADGDPPPLRRDPERASALSALVRDAHRKARLRLIVVRVSGNPVGAENVLTWRTGFPAAIRFFRGEARYGPGEFTGEAVLARRDVDAALVFGAHPPRHLSTLALDHLARIPTVRLGTPDTAHVFGARVFVGTAPLEATAGRVFRMDGVALSQRPAAPHALPTEAAVLARIAAAVRSRLAGAPR